MHAEDLIFYQGCRRKTIEHITELFPHLYVVSALALIIEAIYSGDACTLMVSTQQEHVLWILDLVCEQQANYLQGLPPAIDIVTKHEVVGIWGEATSGKVEKQVVELSMDIS